MGRSPPSEGLVQQAGLEQWLELQRVRQQADLVFAPAALARVAVATACQDRMNPSRMRFTILIVRDVLALSRFKNDYGSQHSAIIHGTRESQLCPSKSLDSCPWKRVQVKFTAVRSCHNSVEKLFLAPTRGNDGPDQGAWFWQPQKSDAASCAGNPNAIGLTRPGPR